jgi:hypothetical protein
MGIVQRAARAGYGQHAVLADFLLLRLPVNLRPATLGAVERVCRCRPAALGAFDIGRRRRGRSSSWCE